MKTQKPAKTPKPGPEKGHVAIQRLDEGRYALKVDGLVRYVGTEEECERRVAILLPKNDRAAQD
jgi:hypothetical protein